MVAAGAQVTAANAAVEAKLASARRDADGLRRALKVRVAAATFTPV